MEINPKFTITDLLQTKYSNPDPNRKELHVFEVLEISTQTCYAGTQIFYDCRPIAVGMKRNWKKPEETTPDTKETMAETFASMENAMKVISDFIAEDVESATTKLANPSTIRFREDELKACTPEMIAVVKTYLNK